MTNYRVTEIYIYPIKSLGGFSVKRAEVSDRGFNLDRRWMLVDENYNFLSQRKIKDMSLLQTEIKNNFLTVYPKSNPKDKLEIPLNYDFTKQSLATVWDDQVEVFNYNAEINNWFSKQLKTNCRLVYMPEKTKREVEKDYAKQNEITSLSDGYPFLIIGQESLNLLNSKLELPISINRFRPNIVFSGGTPHDEDKWRKFKINEIIFKPVKPCARCVVTTINQETSEQGAEPLKTLSTYRLNNNKVLFGMNLLHEGKGNVSVGDALIFNS